MALIDELGPGPWALDTPPFIYFVEDHPTLAQVVAPVFEAADRGAGEIVTSRLTMLELLVQPLRHGRTDLVGLYEEILEESACIRVVDLDRVVLRKAAEIRATTRLRTPDAIHVATALVSGCQALLTGDLGIEAVPGLRVVHIPPVPVDSP